eukprot:TRINITY_DN22708_c0_g1_i1.p1 TRINITY_DN22708_c0_g1~~TRINITY_DN22708_c0_g1_i1.p1  ORF type:complete len:1180 (+),score=194.74 TRINITY_DN22708_c0_g1_i1:58-3540(+)
MTEQRHTPALYAFACCVVILVVAGLSGPLIAFTAVSCYSSRPCRIGQMLTLAGAHCGEGKGSRSEELLHGESCSVTCPVPLVPNPDRIICDDGTATLEDRTVVGPDDLKCLTPKLPPPPLGLAATLAANAITSGDPRLICARARSLRCESAPGTSSILIQLKGVASSQCDALFLECSSTNPIFTFYGHVASAAARAYELSPNNMTLREEMIENPGTCQMGCYVSIFTQEQLESMASSLKTADAAAVAVSAFPESSTALGVIEGYSCTDSPGPSCVNIIGACNANEDGDYYKHPRCVSGQPQWAKDDASHRIRYDVTATAQSGNWIMERPDPLVTNYGDWVVTSDFGTELARQPTFNPQPVFGRQIWNFKCRLPNGIGGEYILYRKSIMDMSQCTCTSEKDCSNYGTAIGSKEFGPNCKCRCLRGRAGDKCEIPLCQVPGIINGHIPACKEGAWLYPNSTCTPNCKDGYEPNHAAFTCSLDGSFLLPPIFQCNKVFKEAAKVDEFGNTPDAYDIPTSTPVPACSARDCLYRGYATGDRRPDGSCVCECETGYSGPQCRDQTGNCSQPLPRDILDSDISTCEEGQNIAIYCTARCAPTYYPVPRQLLCQGTELVPKKFRCFGGPTVQMQWCTAMQYATIAFSCCAFLGVLIACYCFQKQPDKDLENYFHSDQLVEVDKDGHGSFNVIRMGGSEAYKSKLASRIGALGTTENMWASQDVGHSDYRNKLPLDEGLNVPEVEYEEYDATGHELLQLQQGGLPGQTYGAALAIYAEPPFKRGSEVVIRNMSGRPDLDGARGWLVDYDQETGCCEVDLEGIEILRNVPEMCLEEASKTPPPSEPGKQQMQVDAGWLVQLRHIENKVEENKQKRFKKFASEAAKEETERKAKVQARLLETLQQRTTLEDDMRDALRAANPRLLRTSIQQAKELLKDPLLMLAPPASLASIKRVLQTAEARLEQFDQQEESKSRVREYEERVATGKAADWKMTGEEHWQYVRDCNPAKVRAGLKAKLPVFTRSTDGMRSTILHEATRELCLDEPGSEKARHRIEVIKLLIEARANLNAIDKLERTPLDLALVTGGEGAKRHLSIKELKAIGFLTAKNTAREARGLPPEESEEEETLEEQAEPAEPTEGAGEAKEEAEEERSQEREELDFGVDGVLGREG